jgi:hypothetical protein
MNKNNSHQTKVTHKTSAAIASKFTGNVSNFNQFIIIAGAIFVILIGIFAGLSIKSPSTFLPILYIFIVLLVLVIVAGFIRHCFVKPTDDVYPMSAKIMALDKSVEIQGMPPSLVLPELLTTIASLSFPQNEPPAGLIKGDVTDKKSIKLLSDEEKVKFEEDEKKAIQEHQKNIVAKVNEIPGTRTELRIN